MTKPATRPETMMDTEMKRAAPMIEAIRRLKPEELVRYAAAAYREAGEDAAYKPLQELAVALDKAADTYQLTRMMG